MKIFNKRISLLIISSFACFLLVSAQRFSLNEDWQFIRLDDNSDRKQWQIQNQGTDWNSQFNVVHIDGGKSDKKSALSLSDSVLKYEQQAISKGKWHKVRLPHTAAIENLVIQHPWQGVCYYKRKLNLSAQQMASQRWLEFEGAMQLADIWINGQHAGTHAGGFTTFVIDATKYLREGENEIIVRLDNRDNSLIPPGKPLNTLDFCYHSGLYRDVNLICKNDIYITHPLLADKPMGGGILVTYPKVETGEAFVAVKTEVANNLKTKASVVVTQSLYDWSKEKGRGRLVLTEQKSVDLASCNRQTVEQQLVVKQPRLWHPESPNLYVLHTEVMADGRVVDTQETRIGIRRFEVTREGCLINGKPVYLCGTNRHQEYPYLGNAISDRAQRRDVWQMRNSGFNLVRLGHYPQDPSVIEACDELGLLVIEPIPGWQFFNKDSLFVALTYEDVRELIRRDRNHPSILMWETTLNESWPPTWWKDSVVKIAHAEMPEGMAITSGDSYGYNGFDVCYNDWDQANFQRPNNSTKPSFIREYYDYEFGGHYSTSRIGLANGERALRQNMWNAQWSENSNRKNSLNTMGGAVWSMYDYNRGCCDNICESGVADIFRLPKYSLYYYRLQREPGAFTPCGPMPSELFIASRWDALSSDTVVVLGNVAEVALFVNGKEVARQRPDQGPDTKYTPTTNGGNCSTLRYPPFTFKNIKFSAGELKAVGFDEKGRRVAAASVVTPGAPADLQLSYFEEGNPAATNDVLIFYATLKDGKGVVCHDNNVAVSLEVEGAEIIGPSTVKTRGGIASFVVATGSERKVVLKATALDRVNKQMKLKLQTN